MKLWPFTRKKVKAAQTLERAEMDSVRRRQKRVELELMTIKTRSQYRRSR